MIKSKLKNLFPTIKKLEVRKVNAGIKVQKLFFVS